MTISIKPTASGSTIEQDGSTILTVDGSGNIDVANNLTTGGNIAISNTPMFSAVMSTQQFANNSVSTKVAFDTEDFDTNASYDTTNYRFTVPSGQAGKYQINAMLRIDSQASANLNTSFLMLYKNGSELKTRYQNNSGNPLRSDELTMNVVLNLSVGDYIEIYMNAGTLDSGQYRANGGAYSHFSAYKLIG